MKVKLYLKSRYANTLHFASEFFQCDALRPKILFRLGNIRLRFITFVDGHNYRYFGFVGETDRLFRLLLKDKILNYLN